MTLAGFTSRWTMPAAWAAARARAISRGDAQGFGDGQGSPGEPLPQALAVQALHGDEGALVGVFADVEDGDDAGVTQGRGGLGFLDEASLALGIGHRLGAQDLEGHRPAQAGVPGAEEHAHAPLAQLAEDLVAGEGVVAHARRRVFPCKVSDEATAREERGQAALPSAAMTTARAGDRLLRLVRGDFGVRRGHPLPLGSTVRRDGVNFSVFSKRATDVSLVLFAARRGGARDRDPPRQPVQPDRRRLARAGAGDRPRGGVRMAHGPHARTRSRSSTASTAAGCCSTPTPGAWPASRAGARATARAVTDASASCAPRSWTTSSTGAIEHPLNIPLADSVIYEMHVRGFTAHPGSGVAAPGHLRRSGGEDPLPQGRWE